MSSFTRDEFDTLYATKNVNALKTALTLLNQEIPRVQKMYDDAVEDGKKTGDGKKTEDFRLSVGILRGTKAGLKHLGFSPGVGLLPLKNLRREIKNYLKSLPEVRSEVKEVTYGEPPVPSREEAEAEQDAIDASMDCEAEKKNRILQDMILADEHLTELEESPDVGIHELVAEDHAMQENLLAQLIADQRTLQEKILKERLVVDMTEKFRNMLKAFFEIN